MSKNVGGGREWPVIGWPDLAAIGLNEMGTKVGRSGDESATNAGRTRYDGNTASPPT
jgi:hypothetical protein